MVEVTPKSYTVSDVWIAYGLGVMSFDIVRHTHPEIYRGYINVKIRGNPYIIEVASPDVEGIPYDGFAGNVTNETINALPEYFGVGQRIGQ